MRGSSTTPSINRSHRALYDTRDCSAKFPHPCEPLEIPKAIHTLIFVLPFAVGIVLLVSVWHTLRRAKCGLPFIMDGPAPSYEHRLAIQVIALPAVYGVFALKSAERILELIQGETQTEMFQFRPLLRWSR